MNNDINPKKSESQTKKILAYMQAGNKITPLDALFKFNCFRLGARIKDIEGIIGYPPKRRMITVINAVGEKCEVMQYWLEPKSN